MTEEIKELHEGAEEAHRDPSLIPVTFSMAILAVLLAAISLLSHRRLRVLGQVTRGSMEGCVRLLFVALRAKSY
jgi:predicted acyltransferase (DUF342 family)